jgi:hypothetical protein
MTEPPGPSTAQAEYDRGLIDLKLWRGQIVPRLPALFLDKIVLISVVIGATFATLACYLPVGEMAISAVVANGIMFASIAMGSCISAIVLSLGLPGTERLHRWSNMKGNTADKSALSELIFSLTWAALAQIGLILVCGLATLFGGDLSLAPDPMPLSHWAGLGLGLTVFIYALLELVVVVQTLVQIGVMIIVEERTKTG